MVSLIIASHVFAQKYLTPTPPPSGGMNNKVLIAALVIIGIVITSVLVAGYGSNNSDDSSSNNAGYGSNNSDDSSSNNSSNGNSSAKSADLEYSYTMKEINAYADNLGYVDTPEENKIFVAVQEDLKCNNSSFIISSSDFTLNDNGTSYSPVFSITSVGFIKKGETMRMQQVFEIPSSFSKLTVSCSEEGNVKCTTTGGYTTLEKTIAVETSITWDYKFVEDVTSFPGYIGYGTSTAADGNHFIVLQVIEKNVSYEGGDFKPSMMHFKLKGSDNNTYSYSSNSIWYSDDNHSLSDISLGKGSSKSYHIVFEVPLTTDLSSIVFKNDYAKYLPGQDDSLLT